MSIQHGWALRAMGYRCLIAVMNMAYGHPDDHELPFDLRYARWPILYSLAPDADGDARKYAKDGLVRVLNDALAAIFRDEEVQASLRPPQPAETHPHAMELLALR